VLWTLARALLGSSAYYAGLWARRDGLRDLPALVIWGLADPAFRPHHLARWTTVLGPQARIVRLPSAGHWPHEEEPATVRDELRQFLGTP